MSQFALPVCDEIIVDNFAGGGGASPPNAAAIVAANYRLKVRTAAA